MLWSRSFVGWPLYPLGWLLPSQPCWTCWWIKENRIKYRGDVGDLLLPLPPKWCGRAELVWRSRLLFGRHWEPIKDRCWSGPCEVAPTGHQCNISVPGDHVKGQLSEITASCRGVNSVGCSDECFLELKDLDWRCAFYNRWYMSNGLTWLHCLWWHSKCLWTTIHSPSPDLGQCCEALLSQWASMSSIKERKSQMDHLLHDVFKVNDSFETFLTASSCLWCITKRDTQSRLWIECFLLVFQTAVTLSVHQTTVTGSTSETAVTWNAFRCVKTELCEKAVAESGLTKTRGGGLWSGAQGKAGNLKSIFMVNKCCLSMPLL